VQITSGVAQQIQKPPADVLTEFQASWDPGVWPGNPIGKQEVMEQLLQYASTNASSITDPQTQTDFFNTSLLYGQAILGERSTDARINLFVGSFLASWGQTAQAQTYLNNALKESPGKQQILFEIGQSDLSTGDINDALAAFKTAYTEAPTDSDSALYYAMGQYEAGDFAAGDQLVISAFGTTTVDNDTLLAVYTNTKQWDRAASIWQLRVKNNPTNAQDYLGLAGIYFEEGDKTDTIAVLQKLITVDPADVTQIQQIITQVQNGTLTQ
jgi:tetratricopeptide (TPR) repeat protein